MTNVNPGVNKRPWNGVQQSGNAGSTEQPHKRRRGDRDEPKDWRDVHLGSGRKSGVPLAPQSRRGESLERSRRTSGGRRERDEYRRSEHRDRGRDRDRDHRDRDRDRDRERERERDRDRERKEDREALSREENTNYQAPDEEREEGEISPPPPPSPRYRIRSPPRRRRSPSSSTSISTPASSHPTPPDSNPLPAAEIEMELELPVSPPPIEDVLAARRAKRLAIRAKYEGLASVSADRTPTSPNGAPPHSPPANAVSPTPKMSEFALAKEDDDQKNTVTDGAEQQISAADYDPSLDRREDEKKRIGPTIVPQEVEVVSQEDVVESEEDEDEDLDDMFAVVTGSSEKPKKKKKVQKCVKQAAPALITTTLDSAADPEGYYSIILGEQLDGRYQVYSQVGKGMFANVVRARVIAGEDLGKEVAIKIVRYQESMYRSGLKEVQILNKLKQADPDDRKHIIRLERTFEHRGHLCLVFEAMSMNLRDVVKRFGKDVGLNIRAVRAYAHQLFLALSLLKKTNVMHADIKPDNILVNEQKNVIKLCDLGSASDASDNEITPYLVSRFYRAPEIILGIPYDPSLDIWSIGCTLFELYTGKILFPGRSNNQMLLLMMELKGRFNSKMIKRAKFGDVYFDEMGGFESIEVAGGVGGGGGGGGAPVVKKVHISKPTRDLRARLMPSGLKVSDEEGKMLVQFVDLLDKCLALDPARRVTPREALGHPFVRGN